MISILRNRFRVLNLGVFDSHQSEYKIGIASSAARFVGVREVVAGFD